MEQDKLPELLGALVSDALWIVPGGATAGLMVNTALSNLMKKRRQRAIDILLEEIRAGQEQPLPPEQLDEGVGIVVRYMRAAEEGAARVNLRLMAQAIAGKAKLKALSSQEFLPLADLISSLSAEEIMILAEFHLAWSSPEFERVVAMGQAGLMVRIVGKKLVPKVFQSDEDLKVAMATLIRTGLVDMGLGFSQNTCMHTAKFKNLIELTSFEDAIVKEGI